MTSEPRKPRKTMPPAIWRPLEEWHRQAEAFLQSGLATDKPDPALLVEVGQHWEALCHYGAELFPYPEGPAIRSWHKKPQHKDGRTHRDLDPEAFAVFATSLLPGGKVSVEPHGRKEQVFYVRVAISGLADGKRRRAHGNRVIAGTDQGTHTREPRDDFHDLRRSNLTFRERRAGEPLGRYNDADVRRWAIERFRYVMAVAPAQLPDGLTEERYARLLDVSLALLRALPLGEPSA